MELKIIYAITVLISLLLIVGYRNLIKEKQKWFIFLYSSVFIVNCGYLLMTFTKTLNGALFANRLSYLGSVLLPLSMLMIIMNICKIHYKKWMAVGLYVISACVFLIAASGGYTDWYYKDVTVTFINGAAKLIKEYGPLHKVYYVYLFGYFMIMTGMVLHAGFKKKVFDIKHAILILCATLGNIFVWLIEQLIRLNFEFLSVSYIVTELFLLFLYMMLEDNRLALSEENESEFDKEKLMETHPILQTLTVREKEVMNLILENRKRVEIAEELSVTEHTIKKHTANIFTKMDVSSRAELFEKLGVEVRMVEKR